MTHTREELERLSKMTMYERAAYTENITRINVNPSQEQIGIRKASFENGYMHGALDQEAIDKFNPFKK